VEGPKDNLHLIQCGIEVIADWDGYASPMDTVTYSFAHLTI